LSQMFGLQGQVLSDREIAQDILTSHKYLSNYYYAPAILESMDPNIRATFQQIHSDTQAEAKKVFDYLNARGWYRPRQADAQAVNDLTNTAQESRQIISRLTSGQGGGQIAGGTQMIGREFTGQGDPTRGWQPQEQRWNEPAGAGWQPQTQTGWKVSGQQGWQYTPQGGQWQVSGQAGTGWHPTYSQPGAWTGIQAGEGQSGMGPSSLAQGARWGGQPSWTSGFGQAGQWTGTQAGEGQSGTGPSSLAQGARWGGQQSWTGGLGGSIGGQGWQGSTQGGQFGGQVGWPQTGWQRYQGWQGQAGTAFGQGRQWTGTQAGEGQSGMGPSSLAQGARWGGQPSWTGGGGGGGGLGNPTLFGPVQQGDL